MAARKRTTSRATRGTRQARQPASAREVSTGGMTVREAGRKGGLIGGRKGGETVLRERGPQFYSEIGKKGGQRVRELIARGKTLEAGGGGRKAGGGGRATTTRGRKTTGRSRGSARQA